MLLRFAFSIITVSYLTVSSHAVCSSEKNETSNSTKSSKHTHSIELKIAVASNFSQSLKEIVALYRKEENAKVDIKVSPGSSGKLYGQIRAGAPFDMFFSADQEKPRLLVEQSLGLRESLFTYAKGRLVLWTNLDHEEKDTVENLLKVGAFNKLALANPRTAPYGRASIEVLASLDLKDRYKHRWVMGENISQTFQFIYSGSADLGFVSLSLLHFLDKDSPQPLQLNSQHPRIWLIPENYHTPILQDAVILNRSEHTTQALDFFRFLKTNTVKKVLYKHGYNPS